MFVGLLTLPLIPVLQRTKKILLTGNFGLVIDYKLFLALAIYGTVVFPGEPGLIDGHISTIIEQMGTGCSVVPMILGEVIRSLSYFSWTRDLSRVCCFA
jgi:hypothetical protein